DRTRQRARRDRLERGRRRSERRDDRRVRPDPGRRGLRARRTTTSAPILGGASAIQRAGATESRGQLVLGGAGAIQRAGATETRGYLARPCALEPPSREAGGFSEALARSSALRSPRLGGRAAAERQRCS